MSPLFKKVHKNMEVFKIFRESMRQNGFNASVEQPHIKVKKLCQQYIVYSNIYPGKVLTQIPCVLLTDLSRISLEPTVFHAIISFLEAASQERHQLLN